MRRKTTKELLAESFRELAAAKPIDKITVKDITENCGYSVATFYRQFRDKYDLIAWDYTRRIEKIMAQVGEREASWRQTLIDGAAYFAEQKEYLANLFLHTGGMDSFIGYMREINFDSLKSAVLRMAGLSALDERTEMLIRTYVMGTVQLTCEWILGRYKADKETLAQVYELALPEPLRRIVC